MRWEKKFLETDEKEELRTLFRIMLVFLGVVSLVFMVWSAVE